MPVGKYAHAALEKLGVWDRVSSRIVRAENVRAALAFVARGEAPLGIVYRTDALAEKRVRIVDVFPEDSHPPVTYPDRFNERCQPGSPAIRRLRHQRRGEADLPEVRLPTGALIDCAEAQVPACSRVSAG